MAQFISVCVLKNKLNLKYNIQKSARIASVELSASMHREHPSNHLRGQERMLPSQKPFSSPFPVSAPTIVLEVTVVF